MAKFHYGKYREWVWDLKVKGKVSPAALNYPKTKILKMLKDNYTSNIKAMVKM